MEGRFSRFLNTLLVFSTTVSFMLTAVNTLSFVVNDYQSGKILIDGFTYAVILFSGILYNIVLYIFSREKIKATMHVVFLFFYSLLIFLFCYFTHKTYTAGILIFSLILQYLLQNAVNTVFVFHDSFLKDFEGHDGKDLMQHLFHNNVSGIELAEKIKQQQTTLFTMSFFMLLILFFAQLSQIHFSMAFYLLIILFFICVLLDCFLLGIFKNDIFYGFLGFKNYITDAKKLLLSILIITLLSFGAGFFFSSNKAIIKISFSKTNYEIQNEKKFQDVPSLNSELEMYPLFLDSFREEGKPNYVLRLIGKILKYAFISSLAILTLLFFFKPFFSQHFKDFWKHKKIIKYLKTLWNEFIDFLRFTFTKNKKASLYSTVQSKNFKTSLKEFLKNAKRSKEKLSEIDRLTKHFMRLIDWAEAQNIKFSANLAPAEYTAKIIERFAELSTPATLAGQLFEKALYDKNILSKDEEKAFIEAIQKIANS